MHKRVRGNTGRHEGHPVLHGGPFPFAGEILPNPTNKEGSCRPPNPKPRIIMNSINPNEDPLKLHEVVAVCGGIAICFVTIAASQYAGDTLKRIRRKVGRHAR